MFREQNVANQLITSLDCAELNIPAVRKYKGVVYICRQADKPVLQRLIKSERNLKDFTQMKTKKTFWSLQSKKEQWGKLFI